MSDNSEERKPAAQQPEKQESLGPLTALASVFRAWFGVQSEKNRQRDFTSNDPTSFIVAGIVFAVLMIIGVLIAVHFALASAGQ
jgi:uncharacterized membrane protein YesL